MISMAEMMTQVGSGIAGLMVAYAMFQNYFPYELRGPIKRYSQKLIAFFYPYIQITFPEYHGDDFHRSKAFTAIERYLNANSTKQASRLQANVLHDSETILLAMANHEEVTDEFADVKLRWASSKTTSNRQSISFYPREDEKKFFKLTFHRRHRDLITTKYLKHVLDEGKAITVKERRRKLYTNNKNDGYYRRSMWSHVLFDHPANFDTLAMDPERKQEIMDDLVRFTQSKEYYTKIGKAWKRGYLLYGPPGTGKSTMIAAMANLLKYDVYDLELTAVKDNTELRKLLIDTSTKSIVVIEDIDCSLELTGQRAEKKDKEEGGDKKKDPVKEAKKKLEENKSSQVTLSGLLNFIDGLWSTCAGERIIVFTTNYVEKLDPALIRRGRMDKHIELSYCGFEAFKVLAKNYLDIEWHDLFVEVRRLLEETNMTPADVAENLMPKSGCEDEESCLMKLIEALEKAKEEARLKVQEDEKANEEARLKAEEDEKANEEARLKAEEDEKGKEEARLKAQEDEKAKTEKAAKEEEKENGVESDSLGNGVKENGEAIKVNTENGVKENGVATK